MWDDWAHLPARRAELAASDIYTLRRIVPEGPGTHMVGGVAIVGCGLIGQKRARALGGRPARRRRGHASGAGRAVGQRRIRAAWRRIRVEAAVAREDVDIVIVATTNDALTPVALAAAREGKHVLRRKARRARPPPSCGR